MDEEHILEGREGHRVGEYWVKMVEVPGHVTKHIFLSRSLGKQECGLKKAWQCGTISQTHE